MLDKPRPHELEIAIFGPGYGESLSLHVGGRWLLIDSCIYRSQTEPAVLVYLEKIGVNAAKDVDLVLATHWHDDHIRGIGRLFESCLSARFACPVALRDREFMELLAHYRQQSLLASSGVDELNRVFREFGRRKSSGSFCEIMWVIEGRELWSARVPIRGKMFDARLIAASPCDSAVSAAILNIGRELETNLQISNPNAPIRRISCPSQNHAAVATYLSIGRECILLGSDLEVSGLPTAGWNAVKALGGKDRSRVVKVPHHGSVTAHDGQVWEELLVSSPIAIVTPFRRGSVDLPQQSDLIRINNITPNGFVTCPPKSLRVKYSSKVVQSIVSEVATSAVVSHAADRGMIRLRYDLAADDGEWNVFLAEGAVAIGDILPKVDASIA